MPIFFSSAEGCNKAPTPAAVPAPFNALTPNDPALKKSAPAPPGVNNNPASAPNLPNDLGDNMPGLYSGVSSISLTLPAAYFCNGL